MMVDQTPPPPNFHFNAIIAPAAGSTSNATTAFVFGGAGKIQDEDDFFIQ